MTIMTITIITTITLLTFRHAPSPSHPTPSTTLHHPLTPFNTPTPHDQLGHAYHLDKQAGMALGDFLDRGDSLADLLVGGFAITHLRQHGYARSSLTSTVLLSLLLYSCSTRISQSPSPSQSQSLSSSLQCPSLPC